MSVKLNWQNYRSQIVVIAFSNKVREKIINTNLFYVQTLDIPIIIIITDD